MPPKKAAKRGRPRSVMAKQVSDVDDTVPTRLVGSRRRTIRVPSKDFPASPRLAGPKRRKTATPVQQQGSQSDGTSVPTRLVGETLGDNPHPTIDTQALVAQITNQVCEQLRTQGVMPATTSTSPTLTMPPHTSTTVAPIEQDVESDDDDTDDTPDIISGAINGLLSGEQTHDDDVSDPIFQSSSLPLGSVVPTKIKSRIWADEYVELQSLIKDDDEEEVTFTLNKNKGGSLLSVATPNQRAKPINNIQDWSNAMLVFGAIYTQRHPSTAPKLFKYIKTVRDMESKGGNWSYYDIQFRKLKAHNGWNWDFIHWELHFQAMSPTPNTRHLPHAPLTVQGSSRKGKGYNNMNNNRPFLVPHGFCWSYHKTGKCDQSVPCRYKHLCFKCKEGQHTAKWCRSRRDHHTDSATRPAVQKSPNTSKRK